MLNAKYQILNTNHKGLSLLEVVISVTILAILASGAIISFFGYQRNIELDSVARSVVKTLRDAQSRAMSGKDFKLWGVYFDTVGNKFVLFRDEGSGYNGGVGILIKEENYLSSFVKIAAVNLSDDGGAKGIIFNKPKGDTAQYGTAGGNNTAIRLEEANNSGSFRNIIVTSLGQIDSQ